MFHLPQEIQRYIFEFDPTFHKKYHKCIQQIEQTSLKIGDTVMLEENLMDSFYLPKSKCFQEYRVVNIVQNSNGTITWVELNSFQFYKHFELKKVIRQNNTVIYFSFLTKTFSFHHSRFLFDFLLFDSVTFDMDGFIHHEDQIQCYVKYRPYFQQSFQVKKCFPNDTVELDRIGIVPKMFLKLSPFSESYPNEYSMFIEKRQKVSEHYYF